MGNKFALLLFFFLSAFLPAHSFLLAFCLDKKGVRSVRFSYQDENKFEYSIAHMWDKDAKRNKKLFEFGATYVGKFESKERIFEIGFGPHLLSRKRLDDKNLSTHFQFGSFLRFSEFGNRRFDYMFQHLSNAGMREPNHGVNVHSIGHSWRGFPGE